MTGSDVIAGSFELGNQGQMFKEVNIAFAALGFTEKMMPVVPKDAAASTTDFSYFT
jgi:hypothetical protein